MTDWVKFSDRAPGESDKPSVLIFSPAWRDDEDFPGHSVTVSNVDWANLHAVEQGFTMWSKIELPDPDTPTGEKR